MNYTKENPLRVFEAFSGYGSQSLALKYLKDKHPDFEFEVVGMSDIEESAVTAYHLIHGEDIKNYGDVTKIDWSEVPDFDFISWSSPCFPAGTLVHTENGYKPIEQVEVGDTVLTHTNEYHRVTELMEHTASQLVSINAMCFDSLTCTANHPFYVRKRKYVGHKWERTFLEPQWLEAKDLDRSYFLGYAINTKSELPKWGGCLKNYWGHNIPEDKLSALFGKGEFWYLMGRYVGDGWKRIPKEGGAVVTICCSDRNEDSLKQALDAVGFHYHVSRERTVCKYHLCSKELCSFVERYGYMAYGKRVDQETINLPVDLLRSFVEGYVDSDGCLNKSDQCYKITTVSRELMYTAAQCIAKVYHCPVRLYRTPRRKTTVIEGRIANQRDSYQLVWHPSKRKQDHAFYEDGIVWFPIKSVDTIPYDGLVYNLEVETDHSYTANGAIVHNCQDFSQAGLRRGAEEGSGTRSSLIFEERRMLEAKRPKYVMLENVKGLVTKKMMPYFLKYLSDLESFGYTNFWQVLNAKDYGIPQNRERVFVISIRRDENEPEPHYTFPATIPLELTVEDVVESDVDEKFYLSQEQVNKFIGLVDMEDFVQQYEDSPEGKAGLPSKRSPISDEAEILLQQLNPDADR